MAQLIRETAGRSFNHSRDSARIRSGRLKQSDSETNPHISLSLHLLQVSKLPLRFRARDSGLGDGALTEEELGAVFPFGEQVQIESLAVLSRQDVGRRELLRVEHQACWRRLFIPRMQHR